MSDDLLEEEELIYHLRKISKELEYILDFSFVKFWAYIVKFPVFVDFLDTFLMNMRKYNDLEKIEIDLNVSMGDSRISSQNHHCAVRARRYMNKTLKSVFKIFYRLSQNMEGDQEYFSMDFYRGLIYQNSLFDMAKLLDISAVYGQSNRK